MNNLINKYSSIWIALLLFSGCEQIDPLKEEQYVKQIYIVGASAVVSQFVMPYQSNPSDAYISLATGGSLKIDKDVSVSVIHDDQAIKWYNNKYMIDAPAKYRILEATNYTIPKMSTTIKAGEVYGRMPFSVTTKGLHCDSLYALTFKIDQVSDYQKVVKDSVLILNLNLVNDYSGTYQLNIARSNMIKNNAGVWEKGTTTNLSTTRLLKAVDENTVRLFNEVKAEQRSSYTSHEEYFNAIKKYGVNLSKSTDGTFVISPWADLAIVDPGTCKYTDDTFTFVYDYMDGTTRYRIEGTLRK